jgi:hypothetical protein
VNEAREKRRDDRAFETWHEKKYGVSAFYAGEAEHNEFQDWLRNKNESYY